MIDLHKFFKYSKQNGLTLNEFSLLFTTYTRNEFPDDTDFRTDANHYFKQFMNRDQDGNWVGMVWHKTVQKLIKDGWLIGYPGFMVQKGETFHLQIERLEVTDKFKESLLDSDQDKWWGNFVELWGTDGYIAEKNQKFSTLSVKYPDTAESIRNLFWKYCKNGMLESIEIFFQNTEAYLREFGNNKTIANYLRGYPNEAAALDAKRKEYIRNLPDHDQQY